MISDTLYNNSSYFAGCAADQLAMEAAMDMATDSPMDTAMDHNNAMDAHHFSQWQKSTSGRTFYNEEPMQESDDSCDSWVHVGAAETAAVGSNSCESEDSCDSWGQAKAAEIAVPSCESCESEDNCDSWDQSAEAAERQEEEEEEDEGAEAARQQLAAWLQDVEKKLDFLYNYEPPPPPQEILKKGMHRVRAQVFEIFEDFP
jgi:hypothetical protein